MKSEKIEIMDIEVGDIVWVDKEYQWCEVRDICFGIKGSVTIDFIVAMTNEFYSMGKFFTKFFNDKEKFKMYE